MYVPQKTGILSLVHEISLFENEADFKNHGKEIKRAIILGIKDKFDLEDGSDLAKAHELLAMSISEAARFKNLSANQRKSKKVKGSPKALFRIRLAYLVELVNKRANSRFHRMVDKYYPKEVAQSASFSKRVGIL